MITTIGFDADDTLWHNETIFVSTHERLGRLLAPYHEGAVVERALFATEMRNLERYGYGIKSFALSAIETALELSEGQLRGEEVREILRLAHEMLDHPVEVLPHARETIGALASNHRLLLITKGDLRDQERKIGKSGLADRFQAVEIVSEKDVRSYDRILRRHGVTAAEFLMVGNSIKSDILPVLELGGWAVHVPYPFTWEHERVDTLPEGPRFHALGSLADLQPLLERIGR